MKKLLFMLMGVAATINVMAVDYTAKANLLLQATSGEDCEMYLRQSDSYGALEGYDMFMENREVALYAINGEKKLQMAKAKDLKNLPLGLKADVSTSYTITVSGVEGAEPLVLFDLADPNDIKQYPLENDAVINITATANATIEDRFVINYDPSALKYDITLNDYYLATFSAPENVIIPDGLNAYTAEFQGEQDWLLVSKIGGSITGNYIPKNTGVILFNPEGGKGSNYQKNFSLVKYAGDVAPIQGENDLKPATAWATVSQEEGTNYVLHGSEMWLYDGANMKPNKAFLHVGIGSGAPQRICMVFSEEQGIESIAAEGKAVKFVENGRVFIKRGEKIYNVQGQLVK